MRAVLCEAFGPPESLVLRELADPTPGEGEVVVEVAFAALNFFDTLIIRGKYQIKAEPPFSPAAEFSGRIAKIGPGVEGFRLGERVAGYVSYGAARERLSVRAEGLAKVPDAVSDEIAASLFVTYGTTLHALRQRANLAKGETLAVLGASGGVGLAAVELGKIMGARVIACASSPEKLALAARHGADALIDYAKDDLKSALKREGGAKGIDVVYDPVGGALSEAALRAMAWKGRFLVIGFASGEIPRLPLNLTLLKGCDVLGVFWGEFVVREPEAHRANMAQLLEWAAQGLISAHVHAVRPFAEAGPALEEIAARRAQGKVLLRP
jgi:NADPH2:quinone reductase